MLAPHGIVADGTGPNLPGDRIGALCVVGEDSSVQPIDRIVGGRHGGLLVLDWNDEDHGAEDLLLGDHSVIADVPEDSRLSAFADLKNRTGTVFLVLPPDRLSTYSRWLRLLVTQSQLEMARVPGTPATPVLYLLDEFAALGHLAPVERAMGLMAGYGVQLWPILQDVHQLRATYGTRAGTFLSNAGVLQVFGVNNHDSARLVSDLLGQGTAVFRTMGQRSASLRRFTVSTRHAFLAPSQSVLTR